ncbi:MAG: threonine--tRNA ligase [bacterium]|nr:threonine--tRNA ligase [bacterium]
MEKTDKLDNSRHSLAHLLAAAVMELYPDTKRTIGPAIDNGFYFDFEFSSPVSDTDLLKIEKMMRKILPSWSKFEKHELSGEEAKKEYPGNTYKEELIDEFTKEGQKVTFYKSGNYWDLCKGGHVEDMKEVSPDCFKLDRIAGAYWRGDEKNKMLTRIYGLAFNTKEELDAYINQREEAKKRDHRKIAREQHLLVFSDLVGSGMPLYTPKGNIIRNAIINYSRELNARLGFGEVHTPNINKAELFKLSGHYDLYKADMLSVHSQYVADEMFLKPMNCPQHTQIYASEPRSYRNLPIRYSDFAVLYRDERPGELSGLTRLRAFSQDDGHIFAREDQIESEISSILDAIKDALATYKLDKYWMRFSLRDPENTGKYLGSDEVWERSQAIMRKLLQEKKIEHKEALGEAAFYGPKIDIMAVDALGREWQISTIQLDFNQPARFQLEYAAEDGTRKTPVMIHRALIGSPDRFLGVLIEHYAGAFPLWLSPVQVKVIPVRTNHNEYAKRVFEILKENNIRAELDDSDGNLGGKVRDAKNMKMPYWIVVGDKEIETGKVTLESRDAGQLGQISKEELLAKLVEEIKTKQ